MISVDDLKVGMIVYHNIMGKCIIRELDTSDNTMRVVSEDGIHVWYGANDPDITYEGFGTLTTETGVSASGVPLQPRSAHYQDMGIDVLTFCKANLDGFSGYEGALMLPITKYIWRRKDNRLEDLLKARDFLDLLIAYEEEKHTCQNSGK